MATKPSLPSGKGVSNKGPIGISETFDKPFEMIDKGVDNMGSTHNDIGEKSGFASSTESYIVKKGTEYGEAAKLNMMPPGMDISDQKMSDIREMPLKKVISESYPGDGGF